jgi:hypothetical protein
MRTPEGLRVAREMIAEIEARGTCTDVELCTLSGAVGGRGNMAQLATFYAVTYRDHADKECFVFWPGGEVRDVERSLFVVSGVGMYVAGWQGLPGSNPSRARPLDGYVILHPMHAGQELLPRRAYVLSAF